jgi:hypothetical protein
MNITLIYKSQMRMREKNKEIMYALSMDEKYIVKR